MEISPSKSLVIGTGEVGSALYRVLKEKYEVYKRDLENIDLEGIEFEVMHICFPWSENFVRQVVAYKEEYKPRFTIIHSTVPVGATRACGKNVWHSPVRGVHPKLERSLKTFVKYIGGEFEPRLIQYFENCGIKTEFLGDAETTEAMKLWETTQYAWFIILQKEIWRYCQERLLDFEKVYTEANRTYNEGYEKLGMPHVRRPILKHIPGPIGGHCVIPNCRLLNSPLSRIIENINSSY